MSGVQWAVLAVYARTLADGQTRRALRVLLLAHRPARVSTAILTAGGLGLLRRGRLTPEGEALARKVLARHGLTP